MTSSRFHKLFLVTGFVFLLASCAAPPPPTPSIAIVGGTLIDGTGRPPVADSMVVIQGERFSAVGPRSEVAIPDGAQVINADGTTILPGLIDGHCHYEEWGDELYLAFGVTTCPDIQGNDPEPLVVKRDAVANGSIRGPRLWLAGLTIDGPVPPQASARRRARSGIIVETPEAAREAVRLMVGQGADGLKFYDYLTPELAKAATDEAHRLGRPVFAHSLDIFSSADAGYDTIEHFWAVVYTSIQDQKRKEELDLHRNSGKIATKEFQIYFQPERMDEIVQVLVENNIHWSPSWSTWFRPYSPRAEEMKARELALILDPRFGVDREQFQAVQALFTDYENLPADRKDQLLKSYRDLEEFTRRFVAAGGKIHAGSDPDRVLPAFGLHAELEMLVEAGLTTEQVIQAASMNVAQAWRKEADYGSVEPGKVADLVMVRGDLTHDIAAVENVGNFEMVFQDGRRVAGSR